MQVTPRPGDALPGDLLLPPQPIWRRGWWRARWLALPAAVPAVAAYRLRLELPAATRLVLRVSADTRYRLFVDGAACAEGPETGDPARHRYETLAVALDAGPHWLAALVWALGERGHLRLSLEGSLSADRRRRRAAS